MIVADATAAAGAVALKAAHINNEFLAHEVVTTDEIIKRLHKVKAKNN